MVSGQWLVGKRTDETDGTDGTGGLNAYGLWPMAESVREEKTPRAGWLVAFDYRRLGEMVVDLPCGLPGGQGVHAFGGDRTEGLQPCIDDDDFTLSACGARADEMAAVGRP